MAMPVGDLFGRSPVPAGADAGCSVGKRTKGHSTKSAPRSAFDSFARKTDRPSGKGLAEIVRDGRDFGEGTRWPRGVFGPAFGVEREDSGRAQGHFPLKQNRLAVERGRPISSQCDVQRQKTNSEPGAK